MKARAMPVLPEVGSTRTLLPGLISPAFSASRIMPRPMRSFTEEQGFMLSNFAYTLATQPSAAGILLSFTSGVLPMSAVASCAVTEAVVADAGAGVIMVATEEGGAGVRLILVGRDAGERKEEVFKDGDAEEGNRDEEGRNAGTIVGRLKKRERLELIIKIEKRWSGESDAAELCFAWTVSGWGDVFTFFR